MRFWLLPLLALTLTAQTPSFEVASVRPANATTGRGVPICGGVNLKPDTLLNQENLLYSNFFTLSGLLSYAYNDEVDDFDFPPWAQRGVFAVNVKIPANTTVRECRKMIQTLLAERFHMVIGVETREVARYYLKVAKSGRKLKAVGGPPTDPTADVGLEVKNGVARHTYRGASMSRILNSIRGEAYLEARARSLSSTGFVNDPSFRIAEVDVIRDETGLGGYYDGVFEFSATAALHNEFAESLKDALARQLGLTLDLRKAPGKVLVVRSSDRTPTEN